MLPCVSKIFESVYVDQLTAYFETHFMSALSGFRKHHNCQHVLLNFIQNCKNALDSNKVYAALLTDLSRAFDCLPPKLLISKLHAYGLDSKSCMMMANYFTGRKQRVKIDHIKGKWMDVVKGSPQGSLMGPFTYNVHSNDLLFLIISLCDVYNYADDNTVCCVGDTVKEVTEKLEHVSSVMIKWFELNMMKANPDKFQFIVFDRNRNDNDVNVINVNNVEIQAQHVVKLLGVNIDFKLTFNDHISELWAKAGRKLSVLARLSNVLDHDAKMLIFSSFIVSQFNFCPLIWHFSKRSDMVKIEKLHYRALKYVFNNFSASYTELRERSNRPLLYVNRLKMILHEVYKCITKSNPSYLHNLVTIQNNVHDTRGKFKLEHNRFNYVKYGKESFSYLGAMLWNDLSDDFKEMKSQ